MLPTERTRSEKQAYLDGMRAGAQLVLSQLAVFGDEPSRERQAELAAHAGRAQQAIALIEATLEDSASYDPAPQKRVGFA